MIGILNNEMKRAEDFRRYAGDILTEEKISALAGMGYFRLPASIGHHGQQEGDLYLHCKVVAMLLEEFTENNHLIWQRPQSPRIIGLFHDLCKTDEYEQKQYRGKKLCDSGGATEKGAGKFYFVRNPDMLMPGHGEKSIIMAQRLIPLTEEEILCIRFHMGAFEGGEVWSYLQKAAGQYPNILWTMQADLTASWVLNV